MPPAPTVEPALPDNPQPITDVLVAVPVRDEAVRISACLASIERAVLAFGSRTPTVHTVLVLDSCRDETSSIVARYPWVRAVRSGIGLVGAARAIAVRRGLSLSTGDPSRIWIANTDADSQVPENWLTHQVEQADQGADVVCGLVDPDAGECGPSRYAAWLAGYLRIDGHPHVHGANLGIRGDCYLDCGGFAATMRAHEDVALVRTAEARGWSVIASRTATVATSGRDQGRVQAGGFAHYLRACVSVPQVCP